VPLTLDFPIKIDFPIILEGAHSTGKSTLGPRLAKELGVQFYPEIARQMLAKHGTDATYKDKSATEIAACQADITLAKDVTVRTLCELRRGAVVDRSVQSVYAYSLAKLSGSPSAAEHLAWVRALVAAHALLPALYVLVPPNIPLVNDGVREPGEFSRLHIHYLVTGILRDFGYAYLELRGDTVQGRLDEVLRYLERCQEWKVVMTQMQGYH
jgi:nicotinamide riboside kinase